MTRENMVRLSDRELELVETARETLYPHNEDDIPYGMVIGQVAEQFLEKERYL